MKVYLLILTPLLALASCASPNGSHVIAREVVRPGIEPEIFQIRDRDAEMHKAVDQARKTKGVFIAALKNPSSSQGNFEVKKPFVQGDVVEHMWLSNVSFSGNRFHGTLDNAPREVKGVKMGDRVSVNPNEITDWAYVDHGRLVGGYTIRALSGELSPERRNALESEMGCRLGNQ